MPSQKRVVLKTLDKRTFVELSKSAGLPGSQALNKAEIINTLTRKRSVSLEGLLWKLDMGTLRHVCSMLDLNIGGVSRQEQVSKILGKKKPAVKAGTKKAPGRKAKPKKPAQKPKKPRKSKWTPPMPTNNGNELKNRIMPFSVGLST